MKKKPSEDIPKAEIVVPYGYELTEFIDADDDGYGFDDEAIYTEEVVVKGERRSEE